MLVSLVAFAAGFAAANCFMRQVSLPVHDSYGIRQACVFVRGKLLCCEGPSDAFQLTGVGALAEQLQQSLYFPVADSSGCFFGRIRFLRRLGSVVRGFEFFPDVLFCGHCYLGARMCRSMVTTPMVVSATPAIETWKAACPPRGKHIQAMPTRIIPACDVMHDMVANNSYAPSGVLCVECYLRSSIAELQVLLPRSAGRYRRCAHRGNPVLKVCNQPFAVRQCCGVLRRARKWLECEYAPLGAMGEQPYVGAHCAVVAAAAGADFGSCSVIDFRHCLLNEGSSLVHGRSFLRLARSTPASCRRYIRGQGVLVGDGYIEGIVVDHRCNCGSEVRGWKHGGICREPAPLLGRICAAPKQLPYPRERRLIKRRLVGVADQYSHGFMCPWCRWFQSAFHVRSSKSRPTGADLQPVVDAAAGAPPQVLLGWQLGEFAPEPLPQLPSQKYELLTRSLAPQQQEVRSESERDCSNVSTPSFKWHDTPSGWPRRGSGVTFGIRVDKCVKLGPCTHGFAMLDFLLCVAF